jgi:hypothetical protein
VSKNNYYVIVLDRERHVLTTERVLGFQEAKEFGINYPGVKYYALFRDCPPTMAMVHYHDEWQPLTTNRFLQILRNNNEPEEYDTLRAPRWLSRDRKDDRNMGK